MNKQSIVSSIAVLVILSALTSLYFTQRDPGIELKPYRALGEVAAQETAKLLGNKGRVVVIAADLAQYKILSPMMEAKVKSFRQALRKRGNLEVAAVESVQIQPPSLARNGEFMLPDQFSQVLAKHPRVEAIVSLVGLTPLADQDLIGLRKNATKLIVAAGYDSSYKRLLQSRSLQLAILPRTENPPEHLERPRTLREWFDRDYEIVTPETAERLP